MGKWPFFGAEMCTVYFRLPQGIHKIDEAFHICGVDALTDEKHLKRLGDFWNQPPLAPGWGWGKSCGWLFQA